MANYYCKTRTNYFSVTDLEKFKQIIESRGATDEIKIFDGKQEDGSIKYGFYCEGNIHGLHDRNDDDNIEDCDCNYGVFCEALQKILPDDDVI